MRSPRFLISRGDALYISGRFSKALVFYSRALELLERRGGHELELKIRCLNKVAEACLQQGFLCRGECAAIRALNISYLQGLREGGCTIRTHEILGLIYQAQEKYCKAEHMFSAAVSLTRRVVGVGGGTLAITMNRLAVVVAKQQRFGEAIAILRGAIEIFEGIPAGFANDLRIALGNIAELYRWLGYLDISEVLLRRSQERLLDTLEWARPSCLGTSVSLDYVPREHGWASDRLSYFATH
jgi:tetratricopeptide (TPR) repeat protein